MFAFDELKNGNLSEKHERETFVAKANTTK